MLSSYLLQRISLASCLAILLVASLTTTPLYASADPLSPSTTSPSNSNSSDVAVIPRADVLALSDSFKQTLDLQIAPVKHPTKRAQALHGLLFGKQGYQVGYDGRYTRTAMETLAYGSGNCVSLANLYVAAARHVGLDAFFQESHAEDWEDRSNESGYYVLSGHINVLIKLPGRQRLTVEFLEAYMGRESRDRILSDAEAISQYYNNLGMLELHHNNLQVARQYLETALNIYGESALIWSNMGVVEKRLGNLSEAERAYLTALRHDRGFPSAAKNLYVLYKQLNKHGLAKKYAAIVEEHSRRNPYYLNTLAQEAVAKADYREAIALLKKAVEIKEDEDHFHFALARAYYLSGDLKRAKQAMKKAHDVAKNPLDQQRYSNKLAALHHLSANGS